MRVFVAAHRAQTGPVACSSPVVRHRPLVIAFPDEPDVAEVTTQWMDGDILVSPVLQESRHYEASAGVRGCRLRTVCDAFDSRTELFELEPFDRVQRRLIRCNSERPG